MDMPDITNLNGTTSTSLLTDVYLNAFIDLGLKWDSSVTEQQKWTTLTESLTQNNYLDSNLASHLTLRDVLAKTAIFTSNEGKFSSPIGVFNPLDFVGDPRDGSFLYRDNVRRNFFDMLDNSRKAPTYLAL